MAEGGGTEKQLLGQFVEKQTKYGTTTRLVNKSSMFIKHHVQRTDTLMGIALRYSVTVEQVKRENKLWTNDSLFLREHLLIPIASQDLNNIPDDCEVITVENKPRSRSGTSNSDQRSRTSSQNSVNSVQTEKHKETEGNSDEDKVKRAEPSGMDFLAKFDNSIAAIKSNVKKMEQNASFLTESCGGDPLVLPPRKNSRNSSSKRTYSLPGPDSSEDSYQGVRRNTQDYVHFSNQSSPVLVVKSRNSSQKIQTSIERLEKASDEMFQL